MGLKSFCPQQIDKMNAFFVEVRTVYESTLFMPVVCPQAVQRVEQLQMAFFRKPRAQKGSLSAVHLVYKLQRQAAVSTPL